MCCTRGASSAVWRGAVPEASCATMASISPDAALSSATMAMSLPTGTISSAAASRRTTTPAAGESNSLAILAVSMSHSGAPTAIRSPSCTRHETSVPSCIERPHFGILIACTRPVSLMTFLAPRTLSCQAPDRFDNTRGIGQHIVLEIGCKWHRRIEPAHSHNRLVQILEGLFGDRRGDLGAEAAAPRGLVHNHRVVGAPHRFQDGFLIEWHQREEIDDFAIDLLLGQGFGRLHHVRHRPPPGNDGDI